MQISNMDLHFDMPKPLLINVDRFIYPISFLQNDQSAQKCKENFKSPYQHYLKKSISFGSRIKYKQSLTNVGKMQRSLSSSFQPELQAVSEYRCIKIPPLRDDFFINILDWSSKNVLGIGIGRSFQCWNIFSQKSQTVHKFSKQSYTSSLVAIGDSKGTLDIYDMLKRKISKSIKSHSCRVNSIDWLNRSLVCEGNRNGQVTIWDLRTNLPLTKYKPHQFETAALKWNQAGNLLASSGNDNNLLVYDFRKNAELVNFTQFLGPTKSIDWCPQNPSIVAGGGAKDKHIRLFNVHNLCHQYSIQTDCKIGNISFSKISNQIVIIHGGPLNKINVWSHKNSWKQRQYAKKRASLIGHTSKILSLASSPNGESIATVACDQTIRFWHPYQRSNCKQSTLLQAELR